VIACAGALRPLSGRVQRPILARTSLCLTLVGGLAACDAVDDGDAAGGGKVDGLARGLTVSCDGAYLEQLEPEGLDWRLYVKREGAGAAFQDELFAAAEREAFFADREGRPERRDFYWMDNQPKGDDEYLWYLRTTDGWNVTSEQRFYEGRSIWEPVTDQLFRVTVRGDRAPGRHAMRFLLRTVRGTWIDEHGNTVPCLGAWPEDECLVARFDFPECVVTE
jgi:hypothetical protein